MLATARTFTLDGISARPVRVEVDVHKGLPAFNVVGLPDAAVREARERVRAALSNCGFDFPLHRIIASLAPASVRKAGPGLDLPLAVALLVASGQLEWQRLPRIAMAGELALDGSVRPIPGVLAIAEAARRARRRGATRAGRERFRGGDGRGTRHPAARWPGAGGRAGEGGVGAAAPRAARPAARSRPGRSRPRRPARPAAPALRDGGRGGGRPQPADGRTARRRQVPRGDQAALDPAAAGALGGARGGADRQRPRAPRARASAAAAPSAPRTTRSARRGSSAAATRRGRDR